MKNLKLNYCIILCGKIELLPSPRGGGYSSQFVCVCVCVTTKLVLNSIISKSKEATVLKHGNYYTKRGSLQDRKVLSGKGDSNCE